MTQSPPTPALVTDVTAENYLSPPLPRGYLTLRDVYGGKHKLEVEMATTEKSRERGLMWRKQLPEGTGMLFVFATVQLQSFWMQNTLIPLDMLFIDADRKIVGVVEQAAPRTLTPRGVSAPSLYVLEVPGGWTSKVGVQRGSPVEMDGVPAATE